MPDPGVPDRRRAVAAGGRGSCRRTRQNLHQPYANACRGWPISCRRWRKREY